MKFVFYILAILCLFQKTAFSGEQPDSSITSEQKTFRIPKVNSHIEVDAHLDEYIWNEAVKIDANIEVTPGENIPAPVKTEVLMAHDEENIYVAFIAYDPEPWNIRAHLCDRDKIFDDDWILILFDTFNDQRRTYDFFCNPLGIQADEIESTTGGGGEWDAIWHSNGRITEDGYIVEMVIPFSSFGFPRADGDQIWGFDAVRSYPRNVRHHIGSFPRDRNNNCYMCQSHKLIGFNGATPGRNIEFDPTFATVFSQERENEYDGPFVEGTKNIEPGLTTRWGVTPNMTLNTTLNPDFSNIEADIVQLDINNQFAIWYPEKRPFFMESADLFTTPIDVVHTRTLAAPDWGVRLTGKEGRNAVGFYTVQDELTNYLFPGVEGSDSDSYEKKSYGTVFRYRRDILKSSNIGMILTDREGENYYNRLAGIDMVYKFTPKDYFQVHLLESKTAYPDSVVINSEQPNGEFSGSAYQVYYSHNTKSFNVYTLHKEIDEDFRADLGFVTQAGYKYTETGGTYRWRRDPGSWFTWLSIYGSHDYKRDQRGELIHRAWTSRFNYEGPMRSHINIYGEYGRDRYDGEEFRANYVNGCTGLWVLPSLYAHVWMYYGDQIDYANTQPGTRYTIEPLIETSLGLHLKLELEHIFERLFVDEGRLYTANISRIKLIYQFNKRMFLRGIIQYKDYRRAVHLYKDEDDDVEPETKKFFNQVLFSYKINPQTVFFLGYSDDYYGDVARSIIQTNRTIFAKVGYAYRL